MTDAPGRRAGATVGNALIVISVVAMGAAAVYPRIRLSGFMEQVDATAADVDRVRSAALAYLDDTAEWPARADPGEVPEELAAGLPAGYSFRFQGYTLAWSRWEIVEIPDPPPATPDLPLADDQIETDTLPPPPPEFRTMASLSVHAGDDRLLAALLSRYGAGASFVRDSVWTLVMPQRSEATRIPEPAGRPESN